MRIFKSSDSLLNERLRLSSELVLAEYVSLREEALHAMDAAASAVRWSLATYGVIFASGLIAFHEASGLSASPSALSWIVLLVFGGVLPGLISVGAWTWLGEISRLQRAAAQIRSIEKRVAKVVGFRVLLGGDPIRQQRYITHARKSKSKTERGFGKQSVQYVSTAGVFFGLILASIVVFIDYFLSVSDSNQVEHNWWVWPVLCAEFSTFICVSLLLASKLMKLDKSDPEMLLGEL